MTDAPLSRDDMLDGARVAVARRIGRPPGSLNTRTKDIAVRVANLMQSGLDMVDALAVVAEDKTASLDQRFVALRLLFGAMAGRIVRPEGPGG